MVGFWLWLLFFQTGGQLLDTQLSVACSPEDGSNGTRQLNCSTGFWEDGATFSWTWANQSTPPFPGSALLSLSWQDADLNLTCEAANPVSKAFKSVSFPQVCAGGHAGATGAVVGTLAALSVLLGAGLALLWCRWKRAAKARVTNSAKRSEAEDASRPTSAFMGSAPKDQEISRRKGQPQRKPAARPNRQPPHTVYMAVEHSKQIPLQTDDEKLGRTPPRKGERTVYSEIGPSPEGEGQSVKTVYETVKNPQLVSPPVQSAC